MSAAYPVGTRCRTTRPLRFLDPDFPGWGHPDDRDHFADLPAGTVVTIRSTESHGSNPWTRFGIVTADGCHKSGVDPADLERL